MNDDIEYIGVFQIKLKKKFYSLDKIDDFAHNGKPKETKTLIVLTHLAKRFFIPKTFFTENYKDKVVVYGTLKPQYKNLQGGSIFSAAKELVQKGIAKVKDIFSPRLDNYNNLSTRVLKQYGDVPVVDILIYRAPIASMLNTVINVVSLGKWNDLLKKYGFDKLFHLSLVFRLANGKMIIVEKNEVVNISDSYKTKANTEVFQVPGYSGGKTLYDFVNGARQKLNNDKLFFGYHPFTNNCQFFIRYILENAGLYSEGAKNFLFQDLSKIASELNPVTKAIMKGVTDLGAVASKLSGKGKKGKKVGGADSGSDDELSDIFSKLKVEPEAMAVDEAPRSVAPTPLAPKTKVVRPPVIVSKAPGVAPSTSPVDRKRTKTPEKGDSKKEKKGGASGVSDSSAARQGIINDFRILKADIDFLDREFPSPVAISVYLGPLIRKMDSITNERVLTLAKLQEFDEAYNTVRPRVTEAIRRNLARIGSGSKKK